jgi:Protein of unknown function (DUF2523)
MPVLIATLLGGLLRLSGTIAGRVLIALGISVVTYTGLDVSLGWLKAQALASLTGLPAEALGLMAYLKVGVCINIVFSAILARVALNGMTSGTFKRWVLK